MTYNKIDPIKVFKIGEGNIYYMVFKKNKEENMINIGKLTFEDSRWVIDKVEPYLIPKIQNLIKCMITNTNLECFDEFDYIDLDIGSFKKLFMVYRSSQTVNLTNEKIEIIQNFKLKRENKKIKNTKINSFGILIYLIIFTVVALLTSFITSKIKENKIENNHKDQVIVNFKDVCNSKDIKYSYYESISAYFIDSDNILYKISKLESDFKTSTCEKIGKIPYAVDEFIVNRGTLYLKSNGKIYRKTHSGDIIKFTLAKKEEVDKYNNLEFSYYYVDNNNNIVKDEYSFDKIKKEIVIDSSNFDSKIIKEIGKYSTYIKTENSIYSVDLDTKKVKKLENVDVKNTVNIEEKIDNHYTEYHLYYGNDGTVIRKYDIEKKESNEKINPSSIIKHEVNPFKIKVIRDRLVKVLICFILIIIIYSIIAYYAENINFISGFFGYIFIFMISIYLMLSTFVGTFKNDFIKANLLNKDLIYYIELFGTIFVIYILNYIFMKYCHFLREKFKSNNILMYIILYVVQIVLILYDLVLILGTVFY